jgi:hypothetical protein
VQQIKIYYLQKVLHHFILLELKNGSSDFKTLLESNKIKIVECHEPIDSGDIYELVVWAYEKDLKKVKDILAYKHDEVNCIGTK